MSDLADFVQARLAEDERIAREASKGGPYIAEYDAGTDFQAELWSSSYHEVSQRRADGAPYGSGLRRLAVANCGSANVYPARHIARHDPARVLREVRAKRRILAWATGSGHLLPAHETEYVLTMLANAWRDHPDFRPEWNTEEDGTDG